MASPIVPVFLARFTLLDTAPYSQAQVMDYFAPALLKTGYKVPQSPSIRSYLARYTLKTEGPFPDDPEKSVFETMTISGPAGKAIAIARDKTNDPPGTRPIVEQRKPYVTAIAWNLLPPKGATPQQLAELLWAIRRSEVYDKHTYVGAGWTPVVADWTKAPQNLSPYPPKSALPAIALPKPKPPVVVVKPKPPPAPAPPPPAPPPEPDLIPVPDYQPYQPAPVAGFKVPTWAKVVGGVLGLLALSGE